MAASACAPETAARGHLHAVDFRPRRRVDADKDSLCDALAARHGDGRIGEVIDLHVDLVVISTVVLVDYADAMRHQEPFETRRGGARGHQEHIPGGGSHDQVGRQQRDAARRDGALLAAE